MGPVRTYISLTAPCLACVIACCLIRRFIVFNFVFFTHYSSLIFSFVCASFVLLLPHSSGTEKPALLRVDDHAKSVTN
ncbi:hypothetical protein J3F83DRAFT_743648 [Trichoderma novae-zelandiae]